MSAKPTLPPKIDFQAIADEFRFLNPNDPGAWPPIPKMTVLAGIILALVVAGWWFLWSDQLAELETKRKEEETLKLQYLDKKKQAVNLDLYIEQLAEIDRSFGALLKQLPNKSEIEALLIEVNQAGLGRGLQFDLFRPGAEQVKDFGFLGEEGLNACSILHQGSSRTISVNARARLDQQRLDNFREGRLLIRKVDLAPGYRSTRGSRCRS